MVEDIKKKKKSKKSKENQFSYPNLVTPKLEDCLETEKARGPLWSSLSDKMSKLLSDAKAQNQDSHFRLHITPPKTFRKAVAIGVHGYFPHKMVRSVIGQPTGTSSKFANEAADAIERWATAHGMTDFSVTKIALEHEGIVSDRIENLYRILSKHMRVIQEADYIMIAAHSQGTPVAIQLLAKLIEEGHVDNKTIGILAMAGISLGPFFGLDQKLLMRAYGSIENDSLKELFAFQNPNCLQGRRYMSGLRTVIQHGVKITFVGSVNDQLVPLYSSLCAHVTHPYIYRSIFVDGKIHAPTFIISFIELLVKLRNFGYTDHGILRDISDAMAGTLTGGGHSVIYNEHAVYDLAIRQSLETSELPDIAVAIDEDFEIPTPMNYNPYNLPWSVRGLFEQQFVREQLLDDMNKALEKFDEWDPDTKPLKDVKYRLSAIKSAVLGNGKPGSGMPMPRELANGVVQGAA
ncbi:hypothetical protein BZA70DRAFT_235621 [Myxozyma melibiosi]|uniref:YMC020W-like alpha/beta hydrolase domain-containing protein n=1 Tax=Myxozyma melibiosi TaxID=54550 RepID=A0ABR1FDU0_9ASCO